MNIPAVLWIGLIGVVLFIVKLILHIYIKILAGDTDVRMQGRIVILLKLLLPVFDNDVDEKHRRLKRITNRIYACAIVLMLFSLLFQRLNPVN
jgi:hypothetical protein